MSNTFLGPIDFSDAQTSSFEIIPEGFYQAVLKDTEVRNTKNNDGRLIYLKAEIIEDGKYKGRYIEEYINFDNPNKQAQAIGKGVLVSICNALNIKLKQDTKELEGRPLKIKVAVQPGTEYTDKNTGQVKMGYDKNTIKGYYPITYDTTAVKNITPVIAPQSTTEEGPFTPRG